MRGAACAPGVRPSAGGRATGEVDTPPTPRPYGRGPDSKQLAQNLKEHSGELSWPVVVFFRLGSPCRGAGWFVSPRIRGRTSDVGKRNSLNLTKCCEIVRGIRSCLHQFAHEVP